MKREPTSGDGSGPLPPEADAASSSWHCCYVTPVEIEAHVVKGFLEQYGVPCVLRHDRVSVHPLTFCALGQVEILVPADWDKVARGLIAGRRSPRRSYKLQQGTLRRVEGREVG